MVDTEAPDAALFPERVGDRLRSARVKGGLDLTDVATKTRVPLRHLQAIETGDYGALPSTTYAVGFVKSYARAVGLEEMALANDLRAELGQPKRDAAYDSAGFEDADPARIPSRLLAWTAALLAVVIVIGYGVWRNKMAADPLATNIEAPSAPTPGASAPTPQAAAPAIAPTGQVTLTATAPVWLRVYDANKKRLFEKEMAAGEKFDVPADAANPQIRTGRPDLLAVTIGGRPVAALGPADRMIKDVAISAAALLARPPVTISPVVVPTAAALGNAAAPAGTP